MERGVIDMHCLRMYKSSQTSSVVQRQLYLMNNPLKPSSHEHPSGVPLDTRPLSRDDAYDQARRELYYFRLQEDLERRVGREEAEYMGAYFGMTNLEIGMQLEDEQYEKWKEDSYKAMEAQRLRSGARAGDSPLLDVADVDAFAEAPEELTVDDKETGGERADNDENGEDGEEREGREGHEED